MASSLSSLLGTASMASWEYLVNWELVVILSVTFVFYFARLVGFLLSALLKAVLWKRYRVRVTVGAFRVAPLGGRIMARNVVVLTADYTVSLLRANLTWRYWLVRATRLPRVYFAADPAEPAAASSAAHNARLPPAWRLDVDGLEVFMYNRTPAYDAMDAALRAAAGLTTVKRGALVLGNHAAPAVLVASFRAARGLWDVAPSAAPCDAGRSTWDFHMDRFQVHMKPNITHDARRYTGTGLPSAALAPRGARNTPGVRGLRGLRKALARLRRRRATHTDGPAEWLGLRRYIGDTAAGRAAAAPDSEEYAKYSLLLDSVATQLVYYYDTPGVQPRGDAPGPPRTGVDLVLSTATVHYGPWAERQRGPLQALFFPGLARDARAAVPCPPGARRSYAGFDVLVVARTELIVRVPTREFSKDKEELAARDDAKPSNTRPFGWLELKLGAGSLLRHATVFEASARGWPHTLALDAAGLEVRTSVTHDVVFAAERHAVRADIGLPLAWNGPCAWSFDMDSAGGRFFVLREHVTLFADVVADFGAGLPPAFEHHRAFTYALRWAVRDVLLFFNVNDHNIINDPLDFDSNKYICCSAPSLAVRVDIPADGMFAACSTVDYAVSVPRLDVTLMVPPWHTAGAFMHGSRKMGCTGPLELAGAYTYYANVELDHNNFATINVTADDITLLFHGYWIRCLFTFRENYFGDFVNFRTFEEYILSEGMGNRDSASASLKSSSEHTSTEYWSFPKAENDVHLLFSFMARQGMIVVPCLIYDHANHINLSFDYLDVDIHICLLYMDLQADFSTAKGFQVSADTLPSRETVFDRLIYSDLLALRAPEIIIDTFSVHTHRMLGVDDLTYHCKWDFACDLISIDGPPSILSCIDMLLDNFILGYKDLENSLIYQVPVVYDAAHFSFRCPQIRIRLQMDAPKTFLEVHLDDVLATFNDVANNRYSTRDSFLLPRIVMQITDESEGIKYNAFVETSLHLTNFGQKLNMKEHRDLQHEHIKRNDATTHRTSFFLYPEERDEQFNAAKNSMFSTISLPIASFPLTNDYLSFSETSESRSTAESLSGYTSLDQSSVAGDEMYPTTTYMDDDFKPLSQPEDQYKNDSLVLKFETFKACICPKGLQGLSELALGTEDSDIEMLLDKLQCGIMKELKHLILPISTIDNVRLVSPLVDVRIVEQSMSFPESAFYTSPSSPVLTLTISEPSVVIRKQNYRTRLGSYLEEQSALTLALHVSDIYASVSTPSCFAAALTVQASGVESWCTKNEESTLVVSFLLNALKVNADEQMLPEIICFVKSLLQGADRAIQNFKRSTENSQRWKRDLIYSLCNFALVNKILSDPEVITKPARILRSNRDHVRFYESWKMLTKLRSIAEEMISSEGNRYSSNNESQKAPNDAFVFVSESFKAWRPWEGNMKQRENFLYRIYNESKGFDNGLQAFFKITSLEINLTGSTDNYLAFSKINLQATTLLGTKTKDTERQVKNESKRVDIVLNVDAIDLTLNSSIISILDLFRNSDIAGNRNSAKNFDMENTGSTNFVFSILIYLSSLRCRFNFINTHVDMAINEFAASTIGTLSMGSTFSVGWALTLGEMGIHFGKQDVKYLSLVSEETSLIATGLKDISQITLVLQLNTKDLNLKVFDDQNTIETVITEFLNEDLSSFSGFKTPREGNKTLVESTKTGNSLFARSVTLAFSVEKFLFLIDILHPLKIQGILAGARSNIQVSDFENFGEYSHKSFSLEIGIYDVSVMRSKSSEFSISTTATRLEDIWLIKTDILSDYVKVITPLLVNSLDTFLKNKNVIEKKIDTLRRAVLNSLLIHTKSDNKSTDVAQQITPVESKTDNFCFKVQLTQKYFGWFTFKDQTRLTIELEDSRVSLAKSAGRNMPMIPVSGELVFPVTRITIYSPLFSIGLSTLLDYHLSVKLLNNTASKESGQGGQSLQVESEYFRVCLSPPILFKIFELTDGLKRVIDEHDKSAAQRLPQEQLPPLRSGSRRSYFTSVHVLSYNFCIGWLFGASYKDYPGLILGAERIFAVTKADLGKLTVIGGYLSVAHGSSSSNFYSSTSEIDNLNRAFMPKLQLNYYVDQHQKLWLTLKGDELDVRCMSNSTVLIERGMKSGTEMRSYFVAKSKRAAYMKENSKELKLVTKAKTEAPRKTFNPHFSAVQFTVVFVGARVFIYKLQEDNLQEEPNSLTLQSPAMLMVIDYKHLKNASVKHILKTEILMSQSDNTVYSSCVPVVEDFVHTFKDLFKISQEKQSLIQIPDKESKPSNLGTEFGRLFEQADIHVGIRIEKQKISLSCEPTAKVAAVVEYDGASIMACSGVEAFDSIYILGQINSISASLQHIYSDERSGSLLIKNIVLSSMLGFRQNLEIVSSCCISDIGGYIKMKQYQDVDLFRDIWFPETYSSSVQEVHEEPSRNHTQTPKNCKDSSVSGVSVALDFIFSNIMLEVDFGPALGIMALEVDKGWALSKKISSWSYELKLGFQTLLVGSEGRLGGYLKVGGFFLNSAVEWKLDELPVLEVPLVHMAAGFGEIQLKSIFDEHVFAFANLKGWRFDVFNRKNGTNVSKDHLFVSIRYTRAEAYLTSLAVSDFYDIYETISRMIDEKRTSYKEILKDSNKESLMSRACSSEFLEVAKKLDTQIEVFTGVTTLHVYPHSFHDSKVFVIHLDRSTANFTQNEYEFGVSNQIELQLNNVKASFSSTAGATKENTQEFDVDALSEYASRAKGGTILEFPRFMISMRTYQKLGTNVVEYLFQSSFGGTVDIRWNLGSVNCVREMYSAHKRALLSRTEASKNHAAASKEDLDFNDIIAQNPVSSTSKAGEEAEKMLSSTEAPHKDFDKDIQQTMENVTSKSKFTYLALAPAIIEAPRLKELGNATPPLEWFGLHRNKFPDATHQLVIVTLQKLIHEIESEYSKTLGKA
ncbi:hypothetical protein METBIDRAFT_11635 [Metschnikowia bicuspidata var. bicuspidata NRRL YB-4993]|uniref:Protein CSF1 n=1 Tax=Metschnikowia bicuspidata var. bicuspidata NRRL YB-4993 TaxID=869754 RepID=A0A1A0HAL3_9ASCO|nr:hypothetical protein METBIDRAFT_11635 [Metschnikowia bicuspidata var. bicuspidata NRRL YB-4993]OBA21051.1 hypothetical protein METBIDRAFT_11635 [Metschnikowia bicuspidata var. bicuspidata NRRL YB-4993]